MSDGATYLGLVVGFGFVILAGARLGAGSHSSLAGLFPSSGVRDWPTGVQESDAPRFAVAHLDSLRPDHSVLVDVGPVSADDPFDASPTELIELATRRLDAPRT